MASAIEEFRRMRPWVLALTLLVWAAPLSRARADDITDQIHEAQSAYDRKDLPTAIAGLEAALNLLRQSRADAYGALLPSAPSGWTADEVQTVALGVALGGGGTGVTRVYHKGDGSVTVSILADSPLLQAVSAL